MDQPRDESKPIEPATKGPLDTRLIRDADLPTGISTANTGCAHLRLIDDVRTRSGKPTGKVRCLECGTIFDDPNRETPCRSNG